MSIKCLMAKGFFVLLSTFSAHLFSAFVCSEKATQAQRFIDFYFERQPSECHHSFHKCLLASSEILLL